MSRQSGAVAPLVDPVEDRGEILKPVLNGGSGQDEPPPRFEALNRSSGLRLVVLDALGFVEDDQLGGEGEDHLQVAQHLLIARDEKSLLGLRVQLAPLLGPALHDG